MSAAARQGRSYAATMAVGLAAAAGTLLAVSRPWVEATSRPAGLPAIEVSLSGADLVPVAAALGFVVLAAFGAVVATRGWVRRAVGVVIAAGAAVILAAAVGVGSTADAVEAELAAVGWGGGAYDTSATPWRWLAAGLAAVCVVAGVVVVRQAAAWPAMGARYDAPDRGAAPATPVDSWSEADVWKAIDHGHDPTQTP